MVNITTKIAHFSVEDYHRMIDAEIFVNRHVELIDGLILEMSPEGTEHTYFEENLAKRLERLLNNRAYIRENKPITLSKSEPEPDIVVARLPRPQYINHHPYPEDILLLVEVSKSTLNYDLSTKKRLYAQEKIGEYWIVDVKNRKLLAHRYPELDNYQEIIEFSLQAKIQPLAFPNIEIAIADIFSI